MSRRLNLHEMRGKVLMKKLVAVNENGLRIGEDHHRAKLLDEDVEHIRALAEGGMRYAEIAEKFEISKWMVGRICRFERRGQTTAKLKCTYIDDESGE